MDGMTLEKLQVLIEAQTKGFRDEVAKVQNEVKRMTNNVNNEVNKVKNIFKSLGKFVAIVGIGKFFVDSTKQAMKVEGAIQQINRTMGESTNQFLKWAQSNALAFNMSQSDAMSYGAIFSNLVSTFSSGTKETLQYTTDLLKASSIIASGTGRTMQDVMERIRSGLLGNTEAIEDLGVNVNVAMLKSTEAFNRFANGKSWDQLSFQTQQQIRLMAILEQTQNKFGGEVFNNTNSALQQLVAVLKDVALNIGNAFLPILNVVLPILTGFALKLREVTGNIATFMQVLFGRAKNNPGDSIKKAGDYAVNAAGATNAYNNALADTGDTAKKTAKEMNRLLGGFDEINSLSNSGSDGGGLPATSGVGGVDIPAIDLGLSEEPDTSGISKAAEKIRSIFKGISDFIKRNKEAIIATISGLVAGVVSYFIIGKWATVIASIAKIVGLIKLIPTALGVAFLTITSPAVLIASTIGIIIGSIVYLWQTSEEFRNKVIETWNGIKDTISIIWNSILKPIFLAIGNSLMAIWSYALKPLLGAVIEFVKEVTILVMEIWNAVLKPVIDWIVTYLGPIIAVTINTILAVITGVILAITNILKVFINFISFLVKVITETIQPLMTFIKSAFVGVWTYSISLISNNLKVFIGTISSIFESIKGVFNGIITFIKGVFTGNWRMAFQGLSDIVSSIFSGMISLVKYPLNSIIAAVNAMISGLNKLQIDVPNWVPGLGGKSFGINISRIPYLARGGIIDSPTLAMVGEAGKEAVVPLENNKGGLRELASILLTEMGQVNSNSNDSFGDGDLILQIDGSVIGKVALKQLRKMQRQGNITLIPV